MLNGGVGRAGGVRRAVELSRAVGIALVGLGTIASVAGDCVWAAPARVDAVRVISAPSPVPSKCAGDSAEGENSLAVDPDSRDVFGLVSQLLHQRVAVGKKEGVKQKRERATRESRKVALRLLIVFRAVCTGSAVRPSLPMSRDTSWS